ncbi:unnamed protein product, partial [Candidula unifasciata]
MGASLSKTVNTKYEVRHTVEGQLVSTNISKKGSIKKKNKNSVKIKDGHKSRSATSQLTPETFLGVSEEICDTATQPQLSSGAIYRKKSSCVSCEARDVLLGTHRSRSGSEKSLRFSDFNKVLRKTRIYDWEMQPLDIALEDVEDVSLNHLLTHEEVTNILKILADLEISKENITETNYLRFCRHCLHAENRVVTAKLENQMIQQFNSVGQVKAGLISFTQFLNIEAVRLLGLRSKDSLVHLLTKAELAAAKKIFQNSDKSKIEDACKSGMNPASL